MWNTTPRCGGTPPLRRSSDAPALPAAHHGNQYAEAAHHDAVAVRQGFRHRFKKGVDKRPALFLAYIQTGRKRTDKPRF